MDFTSKELQNAVAAEYLLGNLSPLARRRFERALAGNAALQVTLEDCRRHLRALAPELAVTPPDRVWSRINRDLDQLTPAAPRQATASRADRRRLLLWQSWSALATAATLVLALLLMNSRNLPPAQPAPILVANDGAPNIAAAVEPVHYAGRIDGDEVFDGYAVALRLPQDSSARWRVMVSADARLLRVESIRQTVMPGNEDYELWWVGDDNEIVSVGLLPRRGGWEVVLPRQVRMTDVSRLVVTREPAYGSPADGPTGPVLMNASLRVPS